MLSNNLQKKNIIKELSIKTGFSNKFAKKLIADLLEILILNIKSGHLNLKNVGTFNIIKKKKRIGRNPKTKEEFIITSRKTISFTCSKKILNDLNKY